MKLLALLLLFVPLFLQAQPVRINCGGPTVVDSTGIIWAADAFFTGGTAYVAPNQPAQLGTVRFAATPFGYSIPAAPGGIVDVTLWFQDPFVTAAGQRAFNVTLGGDTWISNLDPYQSGSGPNLVKVTTSYKVPASGRVELAFVTGLRSAIVSAIEVVPRVTETVPIFSRGFTTAAVDGMPLQVFLDTAFVAFRTAAPASSGPCDATGTWAADSQFFYFCVPASDPAAPFVWARVALGVGW